MTKIMLRALSALLILAGFSAAASGGGQPALSSEDTLTHKSEGMLALDPEDTFALRIEDKLILTLDECIRLALDQNPIYLAEKTKEAGASASVREAVAGFFPSLNAQGTDILDKKVFSITFPSLFPGMSPMTIKMDFTRSYTFALNFSLPLYAGGRLMSGYRTANLNLESTRESIRQTKQETVYDVKKAFYGYLLARKLVEVSEEALDLAQKTGLRTIEAECQFYAAELARLQRRFAQARAGYQRVLDLLPEGVTPEVRGNASAALAECLIRMSRSDSKESERRLALLRFADSDSPYVHRAKAWFAFQSGQRAAALAELGRAMADPRRQAPELRAELEQTRMRFQVEASS